MVSQEIALLDIDFMEEKICWVLITGEEVLAFGQTTMHQWGLEVGCYEGPNISFIYAERVGSMCVFKVWGRFC